MTTDASPAGTTATSTTTTADTATTADRATAAATSATTADRAAAGGTVDTGTGQPRGNQLRALRQQARVRLAAVEHLRAEHRIIHEQSRRRLADSRRLLARSPRT